MESPLDAVLAQLQEYTTAVPSDRLRDWIRGCPLSMDDVRKYCRFHPVTYW